MAENKGKPTTQALTTGDVSVLSKELQRVNEAIGQKDLRIKELTENLAQEKGLIVVAHTEIANLRAELKAVITNRDANLVIITDLENKALSFQEVIDKLQSDLKDSAEKFEIAVLEKGDLEANNQSLQETIEVLTSQLDASESRQEKSPDRTRKNHGIPSESFTVDDTSYRFICPVANFRGQQIIAGEAILDEKLLAELVAAGAGFIQPV